MFDTTKKVVIIAKISASGIRLDDIVKTSG